MKKLVAAALVLASSAAFAAEGTQSEYFYQATAGTHMGTAGLNINDGDEDTGTKVDVTGQSLFAEYEYGFNEMFSIGGRLTYSQSKVDASPSTDRNGLNNLEVLLRGKHTWGTGLRYGATASIGLEKREFETNGDANTADGGLTIAPYVGYEWNMDNCAFGGRLTRDLRLKDREIKSNGTTVDAEGGEATTLAGFYEHNFNEKWSLGGSLTYAMTDDTKIDGQADTEEGNTTTIDIYSQVRAVGPGMLVPHVAISNKSADNNDASNTQIGVKYRMNF